MRRNAWIALAGLCASGCFLDAAGRAEPDGGIAPADARVAECTSDVQCDDGLFCNGFEICSDGTCSRGAPPGCDDSIACTVDVCDEAVDACVRIPDHAPCGDDEQCSISRGCVPVDPCASDADCDDGFACNGAERCDVDRCVPGTRPSCDDSVACTVDACSESAGGCVAIPDDGACTEDLVCDPSEGCVAPILCTDDADCDDGNFCDGAESCVDGRCAPGTPPSCGDTIACTVDACDEATDTCLHVPNTGLCPIGQSCFAATGCAFVGECDGPEDCDDSFFCNGSEICDDGTCAPGTPPACADTVACTVDLCDEVLEACVSLPDDEACGANETCDRALGCVAECEDAGDCDDGLFCNGSEGCDAGACVAGTAPDCADAVACTEDLCDETGDVCRHVPDDSACGPSETCEATGCVAMCAGDGECDDGLFCNGAETCVVGACVAGTAPDCADAVACTDDLCDETGDLCRHVPDASACGPNEECDPIAGCVPGCVGDDDCDDGLFCNGSETCDAGACVAGTAPDCDDAIACTEDVCDERGDRCAWLPDDTACGASETCEPMVGCVPECTSAGDCDDGLFCNGSEACVLGECVAGTPPDCDDGITCTDDLCDELGDRCAWLSACPSGEICEPTLGCVDRCVDAGDCDDGVFCNGPEACVGGACTPGVAPSCDDSVACTLDACDPTADACESTPDDGLCGADEVCDPPAGCVPECGVDGDCDDGLFCNGSETCVAGACAPGTPPDCDDSVSCTLDSCDEGGDVCVWTPDDGLCASGEVCGAIGCVGVGGGPENPASSCLTLLEAGTTADGAYWVDPDGAGGVDADEVYCDMSTDGGGWALVLKTDASSAAHYTDLAVSPSELASPALDTVAKHDDAFAQALQTTGEIRVEAPSMTPSLYVRGVRWSVPEPAAYSSVIEATTDLASGYGGGGHCYDSDGACGPDHWCFGLDVFADAALACIRRSGTAGIWLEHGTYTPGYYPARVWVR